MKKYEWVEVDKETFNKFLDNYPRKLDADLFMDRYSFYDFTLNEKPCSTSEVAYDDSYSGYKIRKDLMEKNNE